MASIFNGERPWVQKSKLFASGFLTGAVVVSCTLIFIYYNFGYLFKNKNQESTAQPCITGVEMATQTMTVQKHVTLQGTEMVSTDNERRKRDAQEKPETTKIYESK